MASLPPFKEFRTESTIDGIAHLIFDQPGRSMNVFSNAAIHEMLAFAAWLKDSDVRGVVVRSGKTSAFCAGADLAELGVAYDMIMATPRAQRFAAARDHFAPIGRAFRALETAGKPVAAAIAGLALGGGCELALACHYRVMADVPNAALGLPESLVGLFPGAGGTQRLPRLIGLEASLPILLEGARLGPKAAVAAGAAHEVVEAGGETAAAERWVRRTVDARQPWDRPDWRPMSPHAVAGIVDPARKKILRETGGHYPALLAILDCLERGIAHDMDAGLASEIDIFATLIPRPEPRNMIQTLFLGRQDFDKRRKADELPAHLEEITAAVAAALGRVAAAANPDMCEAAARAAGFTKVPVLTSSNASKPSTATADISGDGQESAGLWFEVPKNEQERVGAKLLAASALAVVPYVLQLSEEERRLADYAIVRDLGFPGYAGGPFALLRYLGSKRLNELQAA